MRSCVQFVCFLILLPTLAAAQPTTEDGIRAMLRGEHQAAARILRTLADNTARPDPVAQFFLVFLYEAGEGVRPDHIRACSLFLRAAMRDHPLSAQSAAIAEVMQQQFGTTVRVPQPVRLSAIVGSMAG